MAAARNPEGSRLGARRFRLAALASLDGSASMPYAAAIDVSEAQVQVPLYLIVWRRGRVKCGLKPAEDGAIILTDRQRALGRLS